MKLPVYLETQRLTRAAFAAQVKAHPVTVTKWCTGALLPSWGNMARIREATRGAVTAADFDHAPHGDIATDANETHEGASNTADEVAA